MQNWSFHRIGIHFRGGVKLHIEILHWESFSLHNPPSRYNAGEADSNLSLFKGQLGSASVYHQDLEFWRVAQYHAIYVDQPIRSAAVHTVNSSHSLSSQVLPFWHPTHSVLFRTGNFMCNSGVDQGHLPSRKLRYFLDRVREMEGLILFLGSNKR